MMSRDLREMHARAAASLANDIYCGIYKKGEDFGEYVPTEKAAKKIARQITADDSFWFLTEQKDQRRKRLERNKKARKARKKSSKVQKNRGNKATKEYSRRRINILFGGRKTRYDKKRDLKKVA